MIRLTDKKLDELRNNLSVYLDKRDELVRQNEVMQQQLEEEKHRAVENIEMSYTLPMYTASISQKQEQNNLFIVKLEEQAEKIRDDMREAFSEMKRYEQLQKIHAEREAKKEADRENALLNELALQGFRRKQEDTLS